MELTFCHKLRFSNLHVFTTQFSRPYIFQTIKSVNSKFEKSQVYTTGLQRYGIWKMLVLG